MSVRPVARRIALVGLAVGVICGALVVSGSSGTAASADSVDILVSTDGTNFSTTLPAGIFTGIGILVPGDEVNRTLYVKNASTTRSYLRVSRATDPGMETLFSDAVDIEETGSPAGGGSAAGGNGECRTIVPARLLAPGAVATIPLTLTVADLDHLDGQNQRTSITLLAGLFAADSPPPPDSECPPSDATIPVTPPPAGGTAGSGVAQGILAFTGMSGFVPTVIGALLFLWIGVVVVLASRRRRRSL